MVNGVLPPYPVSGATVETQWGVDLVDCAKERMYFVRNPASDTWQYENQPGSTRLLELTQLPANDPDIMFAEVMVLIRDGSNGNMQVKHYNTDPAASGIAAIIRYNTGTDGRGGSSGAGRVMVGGVNNREVAIAGSSQSDVWVRVMGWWKRAVTPLYPIEGDPIVASWGAALQEGIAPAWEYYPLYGGGLSGFPAPGSMQEIEFTHLPDDPDIIAVSCRVNVRDPNAGGNFNITLYDYDSGDVAGVGYSSGVANKGGETGQFIVLLGGPNGKSIKWNAGAGCNIGMSTLGYWKIAKPGSTGLPPVPVPGTPISSAWGTGIIDAIGRRVHYEGVDKGTPANGVDGQTTEQTLEMDVPDGAKYVNVFGMIRDNNGSENLSMTFIQPDGSVAGYAYTDGVTNRGGTAGPYWVKLGGTSGKAIRWKSSQAGTGVDIWIYNYGYAFQEAVP